MGSRDEPARVAIWWARRDLRLADNQALWAAIDSAPWIVPLFVIDPVLVDAPDVSEQRLAFLYASLRSLDADLRARGSRLLLRRGDAAAEVAAVARETGAAAVFAEEDVWPYAVRRDHAVASVAPLCLTPGLSVHPASAVRRADGGPYTVFTPFARAWHALAAPARTALLTAPDLLRTPSVEGLEIPREPALAPGVPFAASEDAAQECLQEFTAVPAAFGRVADGADRPGGVTDAPVFRYGEQRDRMDLAGTSRLSPYLRFGLISARQATVAAWEALATGEGSARASVRGWLDELVWREFYMSILLAFPGVLDGSFRPDLASIEWPGEPEHYDAWCNGQTGYPVVDAGMRELAASGWMHNRARMIVASFLVKDLLHDWRLGERHFMRYLVDGDPAANNGGWQWCAGTGTDAAPYFRIFNPVLQGRRFDPAGAYVRRWVPELGAVPATYIHAPWEMPEREQVASGCVIGRDYPAPIVSHAEARARALAMYARARSDRARRADTETGDDAS